MKLRIIDISESNHQRRLSDKPGSTSFILPVVGILFTVRVDVSPDPQLNGITKINIEMDKRSLTNIAFAINSERGRSGIEFK